jgi:hypothetical protein
MARQKRPKIQSVSSSALAVARQAQTLRRFFQEQPLVHGNTQLGECDVLLALLCAFFEPLARSLRTIDQLSEVPAVQEQLAVDRMARSTLSDALARFRTQPLGDLVRLLQRQLPQLRRQDQDLEQIVGKIVALDGSYFAMAGEVAWALQQRNQSGPQRSQVRLDLQLDIRRWTPERFAVHGRELGSEAAAQGQMLERDVLYLCDRNYNGFAFLQQVLDAGAHCVIRLKKDVTFRVQEQCPLSDKDREAGVVFDERGLAGKGPGKDRYRSYQHAPPQQPLRLVTIWDPVNRQQVRLLTDLLDVEAWVIGHLYRCRWIIELFFRWLKVTAGMAHLISHSPAGITVQMYVGVIATLLIHLATGLPVSKYSFFALGLVARGQAEMVDVLPGIWRLEREKMLEKQRLARRKAGQKTPAMLPG